MEFVGQVTVGTVAINLPAVILPEVIRSFDWLSLGVGLKTLQQFLRRHIHPFFIEYSQTPIWLFQVNKVELPRLKNRVYFSYGLLFFQQLQFLVLTAVRLVHGELHNFDGKLWELFGVLLLLDDPWVLVLLLFFGDEFLVVVLVGAVWLLGVFYEVRLQDMTQAALG